MEQEKWEVDKYYTKHIWTKGKKEFICAAKTEANAQHICKCVNSRDAVEQKSEDLLKLNSIFLINAKKEKEQLETENARLKKQIKSLIDMYDRDKRRMEKALAEQGFKVGPLVEGPDIRD